MADLEAEGTLGSEYLEEAGHREGAGHGEHQPWPLPDSFCFLVDWLIRR